MTDYNKWSKYDVDGEEQRVELEAFKEAETAKDRSSLAATKQLEGEGVHVVSDMAAKAEAHARVAALRAQGGGGRRRVRGSTATAGTAPSSGNVKASAPGASAAASELALQAAALQGLQGELEALVRERDAAQALLSIENDDSSRTKASTGTPSDPVAALAAFQGCLQHVAAVDQLLPPEVDDGNEGDDNDRSTPSSTSSSNSDEAARGAIAAVRRTVAMVRQDTLRGMGLAQLATPGADLLAEASESLKACLLQDGSDLEAWLGRGEAFARMGLLSLAELHWDQAAELLAVEKKPSKASTSAKEDASAKEKAGSNAGQPSLPERSGRAAVQWARLEYYRRCTTWPPAVPSLTTYTYNKDRGNDSEVDAASDSSTSIPDAAAPASAKAGLQAAALVEHANVLAKEGLVIFKERFFRTATAKFVAALVRLDAAHRLTTATATVNNTTTTSISHTTELGDSGSGSNESNESRAVRSGIGSGPPGEAPALQRLRGTCHVNAAACLLVRQRDFDEAHAHCGAALACSQLGRACLHRASSIASNASASALDIPAKKALTTGAAASSGDDDDFAALMSAATAATSEDRSLCVTALSRQAEASTQLGRFQEAAGRLQTAIELAQGKSGVPKPAATSDGRSGEGAGDASDRTIRTLVARRARILYLQTQFAELDQDSGAAASVEATQEESKEVASTGQ